MKPPIEQMRAEVTAKKAKPKPVKASEALGKHEGKTLMVTQTDRTKVGGGYLGGPGFSGIQHYDPRYANMAWGVNHPSVSSTILGANRRVPEGEAVWSTLIGTPEQHTSNQMVFDKLVHDFNKAAKAGLLSEDLQNKMNERLSAIADSEGKPFFGLGANIRDPELIKAADTFAKRKAIADLIGGHGVGGKKGQIGNYDKLLHATTDPMVRDVSTHSVGPRLFELSGETSNRPDLHSAFPYLLHGQDFGQTYEPVPKELMLRDYIQQVQAAKGRAPGYMDFTRGYGPTQHLSEDFLTHLQKHGRAEGGAVGYAKGGNVEPDKDEMLAHLMLRKTPDSVSIKDVGVNEAPDLPIKAYVSPNGQSGTGLPIGGVDFQPLTPGNQMLPMQPGQQPGQPPMPGQPPQGGMPPPGAPGAPPRPGAPQSNILSLTRPGQAMQALRPNPQAMPQQPGPSMPKMAEGGQPPVEEMRKAITNKIKISKTAPRTWAGTGFGDKGASYGIESHPHLMVIRESHGWTARDPNTKQKWFGENKNELENELNKHFAKGGPVTAEEMREALGKSVEGEEPSKTVKAYKLFRVHPKHPGKLFPLFVDANTPVEMDKWIDAKEGEMAKGKVKSKIGPLAYRPGWHAGDLPIATHIGEKSDPSLTAPDVRPDNHAWAEVEMPDDVDWQTEATKRGTNAQGRVIPVKAHITDQIPKGGHYRYKTNSNMTGNWLIGGSMKVNRVLTDKEVAKINKAAGLADLPRAQPFKGKKFGFAGGGTVAPDEWKAEAHVNHMAGGGKVKPLSERFDLGPSAPFDPIGNAKKSLSGAYDVASKIPGNLKRLVTDPVAYAKSLPTPDIGQLAGAFNPAHIGGIMMGPGSRTWNQKSFEDAVNLAGSTGNLMPPEEVWKRTGNIPNARDFVPRQEINDSNSKFYTPAELKAKLDKAKAMLNWVEQQPLRPQWSTLPEESKNNFFVVADKLNTIVQDLSQDPEIGIKAKYVFDHPELYAAYPELGEIPISQTGHPNPNMKGGFNSKNPEVRIYPQNDPRGTAVHEMQHAVQEIEGMSPGTTASRYGEDLANYLRFHKAVTDAYPNLDPKEAAKDAMHGWYRSHMGEAEARQATERMDMSPEERLNNPPDYDVESNWLMTKPAEAPNINFDPALQYERPAIYAKGGEVSRETKAEFLKSSKVKDVLYRGGVGYPDMSEDFLKGKARPGYATFASTSPHVAGSYAHPDHDEVGAIAPVHIKAHTVHEFPVTTNKHGSRQFDKFAFDRHAQQLQPGHALVARQVFDYGPRANTKTDPDKLYSYPSDIYAWNDGTEVKSALSKAKGGRIKPIGYTKERVTVSPNLDAMNYELMSVKHYTKKAK